MSGDYLFDRTGPPDPDVVELERLLAPLGQAGPPPLRFQEPETARARSRAFLVIFAAAAAVVISLTGYTWIHRAGQPGWEVTRVSGAPVVGARTIDDRATLREGAWIETREAGRVAVAVGDIGQVQLEPESSLRLLSARPGEYRLQLARGTMHALIWSPPGQFFVETPSSTAVDLGCAYTLTVGPEGDGTIRVTSGWVGFEWQGREAFIPAGAVCATRPRLGPGTPRYEDTSAAFAAALQVIDAGTGPGAVRSAALARVLAEARARDAVTLWHLLSRVEAGDRDAVFDRLAAFVPPPPQVTRDGIRSGDRQMIDRWWDQLGLGSTNWWRVWRQPWRENGGPRLP